MRNIRVGGKDENRALSVFLPEPEGFFEGGFGEELCTVEIIQPVFSVQPAADNAVVRECMADHLVELLAGVAVIRLCVADGDALSLLRHRADVEGEPVGVVLAEGPNLVGNHRYAILLRGFLAVRTCREPRCATKGQDEGKPPEFQCFFH